MEKQREPEFRMAMVFSVGLPRSSGGRFFQRDGFNISLPDRAGEAVEVMQTKRSEVLRNLTEEAQLNGDLVVGDYEDTYYNLSLKLFHTYQWASSFCRPHITSQKRPPVFIFLDDDYAFNAIRMKKHLWSLTDAQVRRITWGMPRRHSRVIRHLDSTISEKWSVSKREMPWPYYPPHGPGCFSVMGADVLQEIALAMYFTQQFPIDDAWLGMVMTKWWIVIHSEVSIIRNASNCHSGWQRLEYWPKTNTYELSIVVQVEKDSNVGSRSADRFVLARRIRRRSSHRRTYTFEEMAEIEDYNWRRPIPRSAYLLYPQALDMKQAPIFNQAIRFLNVSSTVCVPGQSVESNLDAIVIVKSAVYNFADRGRIRRVYAEETQRESEFRMAMVFSVGLPRSSGGRFFQRDGFNISLPDRAGEAMEKMQTRRSEVLRNLTEEARVNGDLVLGDYEDTYYNLSLKLFHTFQFASLFCLPHFTFQKRLPVFILPDDDFAFNVGLLKAELRDLTDTQIRRVTWGRPHFKVSRPLPVRVNSKWSVSKREVPWPYHAPFVPGNFYVIGADVLQEIALTMYFTLQLPIDDAWLGLVMAKLDLHFQSRPHMHKKVPRGVRKDLVLFAPLDYLYPLK
nr:unnamed protein product [Spirometra erinaceieuropaei]